MIYLIIGTLLGCGLFLATRKNMLGPIGSTEEAGKLDKILVITFTVISLLTLLLPDLWGSRFVGEEEKLWQTHDPVFSILRLLEAAMWVSIPVALLAHKKTFTRFVCIFGLISFLGDCLYAKTYLWSYTNAMAFPFGEKTADFFVNPVLRGTIFGVLELLKVELVFRAMMKHPEDLQFSGVKDVLGFAGMALVLLFVNMPVTFPAQFTGTFLPEVVIEPLNPVCLIWLVSIPVECFILTRIFRNRSEEDRYVLLCVLSLALIFQYSEFYRSYGILNVSRWPLQVCNLASYMIPTAVLLRDKRLADYAISLNVFGAMLAVLVCDTPGTRGILYMLNIHYMVEHTGIIVIAVLMMTLKIFTPLKKDGIFGVWKLFTVQFVLILIFGTAMNAIGFATGDDWYLNNFFFIFDGEMAGSLIPILKPMFAMELHLGGQFVSVNLAQAVMYVGYMVICTGMYYLFYAFFREKKTVPQKG